MKVNIVIGRKGDAFKTLYVGRDGDLANQKLGEEINKSKPDFEEVALFKKPPFRKSRNLDLIRQQRETAAAAKKASEDRKVEVEKADKETAKAAENQYKADQEVMKAGVFKKPAPKPAPKGSDKKGK